jgi:GTPase SAR1 family protein
MMAEYHSIVSFGAPGVGKSSLCSMILDGISLEKV